MRTVSSPTTAGGLLRASLLLAAGIVAASAAAADEGNRIDPPSDFGLSINRSETDLDYPGDAVSTRINRIGVHWRERYAPLWLGLVGGYSYVTQTGHPATAGLELAGYHAGVTFEATLYATSGTRVTFGGEYLYERVREETDGDDVALAWHIPSARLRAEWRWTPLLELYGGVRYDYLKGEERLHGTRRSTIDVEHGPEAAGMAGLQLHLDDGGYVTLEANGGAVRGVTLSFGRQF